MKKNYVLGEFHDSVAMLDATAKLRDEKHGLLDTHTAYPIHGIDEALGLPRSRVSLVCLCGGIAGVFTAYAMQLYFNWFDYQLNVGNKPPHAPIIYVPVTFELMVLMASVTMVLSLIVYFWRFPRPHHPLFEHEPFLNATTTGWWVSMEIEEDEKAEKAKARLSELGAKNIAVVVDKEAE